MTAAANGSARVLVIDDDLEAGAMIAAFLRRLHHEPEHVSSPLEALSRLGAEAYALVVTDVKMAGMDGIALCAKITEAHPDVPVIVLTGHGGLDTAVAALRAGAFDYLSKPVDGDMLSISVDRALAHRSLCHEVSRLRDAVGHAVPQRALVGSSRAMRDLLDFVGRIATTDATVLITGESGTGKELVARAIHGLGARRAGPFVAINCAAVPHELLESELFGHVRGAFTDARNARPGLFTEADGGTLFLDEIGEMPLDVQAKLLRALQERTVRPVGGNKEVPFDARIVTATNRDLAANVQRHTFREDLYYRIAVVCVEVPTLRERSEDIAVLAQHFVERFAGRFGKKVLGLQPAALGRLAAYPWPGNVRELENSIERAVALTRYDHVTVDDLPDKVRAYEADPFVVASEELTELIPLAELEQRYARRVLALVGGNKSRAARVLGVDRRTLYRMLERDAGDPPNDAMRDSVPPPPTLRPPAGA